MILSKSEAVPERMKAELQRLAERIGVERLDEALLFPRFFQLETTRLCNARCPFCAIDQWDKSTPFMSDELFKKIADEIIGFKDWVKFVDVQRAGEPLLDKKIYERVAYFKRGGIKVVALATNASGLNEKNARKLLEAGIDDVMLSIDSVEKDEYEKSRVGLHYETVLANIRTFFRLRDKIRPQAVIRVRGVSRFDEQNPEHLKKMAAWKHFWDPMSKPHDRIYFKRAHNWGNQVDVKEAEHYGLVYHPCIVPWSTMHITAMGVVAMCPQDYDGVANFGDLNHQTIVEVWRGKIIEEVRRKHACGTRNDIKLCQGCRIFDEEFSIEKDSELQKRIETVGAEKPADAVA